MRHDDLVIEQGTTWDYAWPVDQGGNPIDLSNWTARAQIRESVDSPTVLFEWSTVRGNATLTGSAVTLLLTPADSAVWAWTNAVYDVVITDPIGRVARVAGGVVTVSREVTR